MGIGSLLGVGVILGIAGAEGSARGASRAVARDVVGASHVAGKYNFTDKDFLNEGADALLEMGTRVIKVWFEQHDGRSYPFNSDWPKVHSLIELARTPYFTKLFDKPFTTFILETYAPGRADDYFLQGMSPADVEHERKQIEDVAAYLLERYRGTGKTFVIQNWEGDWSLRGGAPGHDPTPGNVRGMIDWFNARQDGVEAARRHAGEKGVHVYHAAEVNHVARAMKGEGVTVTNDVLPHTHCDLYSYSAYDVHTFEPETFRAALDYLRSKAPDSATFGAENVYVGEYGAPENVVGGAEEQLRRIKLATTTAMDWGARYVVYWELYCNEPKHELKGARPGNEQMRGFWLIRPDGTRPAVTDFFVELWKSPK